MKYQLKFQNDMKALKRTERGNEFRVTNKSRLFDPIAVQLPVNLLEGYNIIENKERPSKIETTLSKESKS